ncbi:MAG: hypothetical protein AAGL96_02150, partial [Pseudomonadota bacterium]
LPTDTTKTWEVLFGLRPLSRLLLSTGEIPARTNLGNGACNDTSQGDKPIMLGGITSMMWPAATVVKAGSRVTNAAHSM